MAAAMINKAPSLFLLVFISALLVLASCEREDLNPDYPFKVVVKTHADSIRVQNVSVEVLAPTNGNVVFLTGTTNEAGEVEFVYDKPAILLVRALRGERPDLEQIGCTEFRLAANEQVTKTVYIKPFDETVIGCAL